MPDVTSLLRFLPVVGMPQRESITKVRFASRQFAEDFRQKSAQKGDEWLIFPLRVASITLFMRLHRTKVTLSELGFVNVNGHSALSFTNNS